ncbi:MAG TPA: class IV adenylate cyclase [Pirellulales bacterium]|nr:class IV adenylate cyclase [Pirellulales bacterium]
MDALQASAVRRNVELKARLRDPGGARRLAVELSGGPPQVLRQTDTYYRCPRGRLKLRQFAGGSAELIAYSRANEHAPRLSRYHLVPVTDAGQLHQALSAALGVLIVVKKVRELSLYKNVRIHIDEVDRLGAFVEFEAVLESQAHDAEGEPLVRELSARFGLESGDLIAESYSDMLLRAGENTSD